MSKEVSIQDQLDNSGIRTSEDLERLIRSQERSVRAAEELLAKATANYAKGYTLHRLEQKSILVVVVARCQKRLDKWIALRPYVETPANS